MRAVLARLIVGPMLGPMLSAVPAGAVDNDYAALMRAHKAELRQVAPGERVLELPGPVVVHERQGTDGPVYRATDLSGLGAVGCFHAVLLEAVVTAGLCEDVLRPEEQATVDARLLAVARFVAENRFPPGDAARWRETLLEDLAARKAEVGLRSGGRCPLGETESGTQDAREALRNLARPAVGAAIERAVSVPRLPVENPCS